MSQKDLFKRFRPNVGIVLFNAKGQVWFGRRVIEGGDAAGRSERYRWQMPQGGVDAEEDIDAAAYRELKEETGVSSATLLCISAGWLAYRFPAEEKKKNWKGQRQKWAAMLFTGEDSEIDLEADDHQEFDDWRWGELEEAPSLIVPFKRPVYEDVVEGLKPLRDFLRARA